jgi:hypothetical protein
MTTDRTSRRIDDSRDEAAGKSEPEICSLVRGVGEGTAAAIYVVARVYLLKTPNAQKSLEFLGWDRRSVAGMLNVCVKGR